MNRTIRRNVALVTLTITPFALVACGSSNDDEPVADDAVTTTVADDPVADQAVDQINDPAIDPVYTDLKAQLAKFDDLANGLPDDAQADYAKLKADIDHAEGVTGDQATAAYATVKDDIDALHDKISELGDTVDSGLATAWNDVKAEFDQIDGGI